MIQPTHKESMADERTELLRFCTRYTGDPHAAEDLAQQTLLQAWLHEQQLRDPRARRGWLLGIARNQCRMWARSHGRELARSVELGAWDGAEHADGPGADPDLLGELEREELAALVERALALLPAEIRDVLVRRYVEDVPQAEVAARLKLSEGAVEARLHRGRRALRRVLTTELGDEAAAHGLIARAEVGWEETRVWCPNCGRRLLEGWFRPNEGKLYMRCPGCASSDAHYIHSHLGDGFSGLHTYRPALGRVLDAIHTMFRLRAAGSSSPCIVCGRPLPFRRGEPPWVERRLADPESIYLWCADCGFGDSESWHSLTWSLPAVRAFWRDHPRMRFVPPRSIEAAGGPAVLTGFESASGPARVEAVMMRDTLEVVSVNGQAPAEQRADG